MSYNTWFICGAIFVALELLLPGGIIGTIGVCTLLVALLIWLGWLTSFLTAILIWLILVVSSVFVVRRIMRKLSPSQSSVGIADEDEELRGTLVLVTERIPPNAQGRVLIRGSSWMAKFVDPTQSAEIGTYVCLVAKDNIIWSVKVHENTTGETL